MPAVDLVISFDTTSSMHAVLEATRRHLGSILRSLFDANADLRVGLILHGDYGDLYETRLAQPTDGAAALVDFLAGAPDTCGLDYPECYELVLHQAATRVRWRRAATRMLVMLGDAVPHEPGSRRNKYGLDWRKEARRLAGMRVAVHCVDCGGVGTGFYGFARELCDIVGGGAIVPYGGCGQLRRLLKQLVLTAGGGGAARQALDRRYRSYHKDSQQAETAPTSAAAIVQRNQQQQHQQQQQKHQHQHYKAPTLATAKATLAQLRPSHVALALARGGGAALGKTAHCAARLLVYCAIAYLLYSVCIDTFL